MKRPFAAAGSETDTQGGNSLVRYVIIGCSPSDRRRWLRDRLRSRLPYQGSAGMWVFFRLSDIEKEQEARHLALGRAAAALGRKVLAENPRPNFSPKPPSQVPLGGRMHVARDRAANVSIERRDLERQHLSAADAHIAKGERLIRGQMATLEHLRCLGHDTSLAEATLSAFEANLKVMCEHRDLIVRTIEEIDHGS